MHCRETQIIKSLVESYQEIGGINHIDGVNLPSKRVVGQLCKDLLRLMFPGFFDETPIPMSEIEMLTTERVYELRKLLQSEIERSLRFSTPDKTTEILRQESHNISCNFLHTLPIIRRLLNTDVDAAFEGDPAARSREEIILSYPCLEAISIQRCAHVLYDYGVLLIPRMMTEWAHSRTGIDIHPGAVIGSHFFIDHGTGVVIGETCTIGSHVKLYHGVTLGAKSFPKDSEGHIIKGTKRHPDVEGFVTIYPNATVLGGATVIGAHSTIGGNVCILNSLPADSLVNVEEQEHIIRNKSTKKRALIPV